ncbi:MAG: nucleotidyltransferase domain-containing protein [Cytophagales bacterium]|nr:nucleotidyltransferase domain-containing protein [Cytophagales bacterium]
MITRQKITEIVNKIALNYKPEKIILFGSYADDNPTDGSDLDLLIIKDSNLPRYKRSTEIRKHLRGITVPMDLIVYTKDEIQKWKDTPLAFVTKILKQGKVIYG